MLPDWRIYYTESETYSSLDGPPADAPREGFLCAVGYDEVGKRYLMHGWDFYRFSVSKNQWWGADLFGVVDWARKRGYVTGVTPGSPSTIHTTEGDYDTLGFIQRLKDRGELFEGRTCSRSEWSATTEAAHADPDFPLNGRS